MRGMHVSESRKVHQLLCTVVLRLGVRLLQVGFEELIRVDGRRVLEYINNIGGYLLGKSRDDVMKLV